MAFDDIIGNTRVKETLNKILESNNILHAYLFSGKNGIGKMMFAKEFSKQILVLDEVDANKELNMKLAFDNYNHPDFGIIETLEGENSISVEQIRLLNEKILEKPIQSSRKVYVIKDAEKMTTSAQNALLKTLEEPPEYASIILVCNDESKILTTIKSRTTKVLFENLSIDDIKKYCQMENIKLDDVLIDVSNGSIGTIVKANENIKMYDEIASWLKSINNIQKYEVWNSCEELYKNQDNVFEILDYIDICLIKRAKENVAYAECINEVTKARRRLKANANFNMTIDNFLLSIWEDINEKHSRG